MNGTRRNWATVLAIVAIWAAGAGPSGLAYAAGDWYGYQGSVSGSTAVVGQRFDATTGFGDVVVHTWSGGDRDDWPETLRLSTLLAPNSVRPDAEFGGGALVIDGDTILAAAYRNTLRVGFPDPEEFDEAGSAYVFTRSGNVWSRQAQLVAPGGAVVGAQFGAAGDLDGDYALLTAPGVNAAYVFTRTGSSWNSGVSLAGGTINLPTAAALDGNVAVVGSLGGGAHVDVWRYSAGSGWGFETAIANPGDGDNLFGSAVSLSGDTLVVGARRQDMQIPSFPQPIDLPESGVAYVYRYNGSAWGLEQTIENPDPGTSDWFAFDVAVDGDQLLIGAPRDDTDGVDAGLAYLYERSGSSWTLSSTIHHDDAEPAGKWFGQVVGLDEGNRVIAGTGRAGVLEGVGDADFYAAGAGPVWPPGDANKDGVVNHEDAARLAAHWLQQGGAAWGDGDFNGDGNVDDLDASILAANWAYGGGGAAAVPEPSALVGLLALVLAAAAALARRK